MSQNLEIKRYCPDFKPIRSVSRQTGSSHIVTKRQADTYFKPYLLTARPYFVDSRSASSCAALNLAGTRTATPEAFRRSITRSFTLTRTSRMCLLERWESALPARSVVNAGRSFSLPKTRLSTFPYARSSTPNEPRLGKSGRAEKLSVRAINQLRVALVD